jgi:pilus assembly protein CpaB
MKPARLIVLFIALAAGGLAAILAGGSNKEPAKPAASAPQLETVEVLTVKNDIGFGQKITAADIQWQPWPKNATSPSYIRKADMPDAITKIAGSIARSSFMAGEPIREAKLVKADGSGFMAAILPSGKRAISTEINPETSAGGFILPNDRVDVILSRREKDRKGDHFVSETILTDVRVLAIDQTLGEKDGQKVVLGKTATLELSPREAETLAVSRQQGTLSLALRSMADANRKTPDTDEDDRNRGVNTVRFGVTTSTAIK